MHSNILHTLIIMCAHITYNGNGVHWSVELFRLSRQRPPGSQALTKTTLVYPNNTKSTNMEMRFLLVDI